MNKMEKRTCYILFGFLIGMAAIHGVLITAMGYVLVVFILLFAIVFMMI